ncbi:MAG TPA: c-type cytochrome domain-containing protein [Gemmataceae bacterium]|nr:c-type cytochrome domain-containing protein [Gemmataceae bacterium]
MSRNRFSCYCILCALLGLALAWLLFFSPSSVQAQVPKGPVSFIKDVAPILQKNCFACHDAKKKKGKFEMTSWEAFRKGGSKDDPIEAGKSKDSLLIHLVTSTKADRMPPKDAGDALKPEQVAIIAKWIDEGAKLDKDISPKADLVRELRIRYVPPQPFVSYKFPTLINALAFTPDSKRVVVGGNHELTVWDATTGKLLRRVFTRAERAHAMAFLPDGKLVVAGGRPGQEGDVRIYNIDAGTPKDFGGVPSVDGVNDKTVLLKELVQVEDSILALGVSKDGKKIAAGGTDRMVRVFDVDSGKMEHAIENHADWILGVVFSPDAHAIVTASRDKTAKMWDLKNKESLLTFPDHQNIVNNVAMTPDGVFGLSAGEDGSIRIWQATDKSKAIGKATKNMGGHSKAVFRLASFADGKNTLIASCSADMTVRLWNPVAGTALKTLSGMTDWVYAVAISPNGQLVAGGAANGEVRVWKTGDGNLVTTFNATPGYTAPKVETPKKK